MLKKIIIGLWVLLVLGLAALVFVFSGIAKGKIGYMPPVEDLENPNYKFATEVISDDGVVLGTYSYSKENRVYVGYNEVSKDLINALIATEDVPLRNRLHRIGSCYHQTRCIDAAKCRWW